MVDEKILHQQLLEFARTTVELSLFIEEIRLIQDALYSTSAEAIDQVLQEKVRFEVAQSIKPLLTENSAQAHELLESIKQTALNQKILSLTISFRPSSAFVATVMSWVRSHIGEGIVLDFKYEPAVVGGAVIDFNGHYGDFSLRKKFQAYFDSKLLLKGDQNSQDPVNMSSDQPT